jgi:hypothetical protein
MSIKIEGLFFVYLYQQFIKKNLKLCTNADDLKILSDLHSNKNVVLFLERNGKKILAM